MTIKPGQSFEHAGRYFRLRKKSERVSPTDYHVGLGFDDTTHFTPCVRVRDSNSMDYAYDRGQFDHIEELEPLIYHMLKAKQENGK